MKVLLIEDNPEILESVAMILELRWPEAGLITTFFGGRGMELVQKETPDIVILDLGLPDLDGFQVLRQIRSFSDVPLIIFTAKEAEMDRIKGLELGADDYIVKPFSTGEFLARVKAVLRRRKIPESAAGVAGKPYMRGELRADFTSMEVSVGSEVIKLSPVEYNLLYQLVTNEGRTLSNEALLEEASGPEHKADTEYLRTCIKRLKNELEKKPGTPTMIFDEAGTGYKFLGA